MAWGLFRNERAVTEIADADAENSPTNLRAGNEFECVFRKGELLGRGTAAFQGARLIIHGQVSPVWAATGMKPLFPEGDDAPIQTRPVPPPRFQEMEADIWAAQFALLIHQELPYAELPDPQSLIAETGHPDEMTLRLPTTAVDDPPLTLTFPPDRGAEFLAALTAAWNETRYLDHA